MTATGTGHTVIDVRPAAAGGEAGEVACTRSRSPSVVAVLVAYFYYCGAVEERNLTATFPQAYPEYKGRTKMLIPFLL
jgi:hypothetical protein